MFRWLNLHKNVETRLFLKATLHMNSANWFRNGLSLLFQLRGNLDFLYFIHKRFYNINNRRGGDQTEEVKSDLQLLKNAICNFICIRAIGREGDMNQNLRPRRRCWRRERRQRRQGWQSQIAKGSRHCSVTRFGEISPLWQKNYCSGQHLEVYLLFGNPVRQI